MSILIVDDEPAIQRLLNIILRGAGHQDVRTADSAREAFQQLGLDQPGGSSDIDLILMDITMQEIDGLEACRRIKAAPHLVDIPIIIVTGRTEPEDLEIAFEAGAMDYVAKPFNRVALMARVQGALRLKQDLDRRKAREQELISARVELEAAKQHLERISAEDALTGIANRRHFDEFLELECRRACRLESYLSLIMVDVDQFKIYNDTYGHAQGDRCLRQVAQTLAFLVKRPRDLVARYGGEEFVVVLPDTDAAGAVHVAEQMRAAVEALGLKHRGSSYGHVTISAGVATKHTSRGFEHPTLVEKADHDLYRAKKHGRNRVSQSIL
jgi:diguanylate cyclase (GGDEF)-like protein